jgi:glutathione S-transferase
MAVRPISRSLTFWDKPLRSAHSRVEEQVMPIEFVELDEARACAGLRMVVVPGVPSPWGEAAKGILHVKQIPYCAVRLDQASGAMAAWTGQRSGPVAMYDEEAPRGGWAEILMLSERLAPSASLLPDDPADRALAIGLSHEICGEMGLGWCRRLQSVRAGLSGEGGFPKGVAKYLAEKYGYRPEQAPVYDARVIGLLGSLATRLRSQRDGGSRYLLGSDLTAVDIYLATFMALFSPLPHEYCPMPETMRAAFEAVDSQTEKTLDAVLADHRDFIYREHLELPLTL